MCKSEDGIISLGRQAIAADERMMQFVRSGAGGWEPPRKQQFGGLDNLNTTSLSPLLAIHSKHPCTSRSIPHHPARSAKHRRERCGRRLRNACIWGKTHGADPLKLGQETSGMFPGHVHPNPLKLTQLRRVRIIAGSSANSNSASPNRDP